MLGADRRSPRRVADARGVDGICLLEAMKRTASTEVDGQKPRRTKGVTDLARRDFSLRLERGTVPPFGTFGTLLQLSLGLQVPRQVFGPPKATPNTFLEGTWSPRVYIRATSPTGSSAQPPQPAYPKLPNPRLERCARATIPRLSTGLSPAFPRTRYISSKGRALASGSIDRISG